MLSCSGRPVAWGQKPGKEFCKAVQSICDGFAWSYDHRDWLMACIAFESGETFSPSIKNMAGSGATGLIQFMPATARGLGTTTDALAAMDPIQQLHYVQKYFRPYYRRIRSLSDMYMAILMPKYVGQDEDAVLFSSGIAYRQNAGLDSNKDGKITKREASQHVQKKLIKGLAESRVLYL